MLVRLVLSAFPVSYSCMCVFLPFFLYPSLFLLSASTSMEDQGHRTSKYVAKLVDAHSFVRRVKEAMIRLLLSLSSYLFVSSYIYVHKRQCLCFDYSQVDVSSV